MFQECGIEDVEIRNAIQSMPRGFHCHIHALVVNHSAEVREAHDRWSEFLADRGFVIQDRDSIERGCAALKGTFRCDPCIIIIFT